MRKIVAVVVSLLALGSPDALGQCGPLWLPGEGIPGTDSALDSAVAWDPDGAGPLPLRLVIGGGFEVAGETITSGIAMWNGTAWEPLGNADDVGVSALAVFNGELIATGRFDRPSPLPTIGPIARLVNNQWEPLGSVVSSQGTVNAMRVHNGALIVAGGFSTIGGVTAANVARWDGTNWSAMGTGLNNQAFSLGEFNGEVVVGGQFTMASGETANRVARWNGTAWQALGTGMATSGNNVWSLGSFNGELVAGGQFSAAGGTLALNIARWNGSVWQALGTGLNGTCRALTTYQGQLYAGGSFGAAGGVTASGVARWNGSSWQALPGSAGSSMSVRAFTDMGSELFIGGSFVVAGGVGARNIAGFDGANGTWRRLGVGMAANNVQCFASFEGDLIAGGDFTVAGGVAARSVGRWNGVNWEAMGAGVFPPVASMIVFNGELIIGGGGLGPTGGSPLGVARWNGAAWQGLGAGLPGLVSALIEHNGELIAGGAFSIASGGNADFVARWDGTSWQPLGSGISGPAITTAVYELAVYKGELIAAGWFTGAGGQPAMNIAKWNGTTWAALGAGLAAPAFSLPVYGMVVWGNELVVGGGFTTAAGAPASYLARWNGTTWQGFLPEPFALNLVSAVGVYQGDLIVDGGFFRPARWTGSGWAGLGTGTNLTVNAFHTHRGELVAGGTFSIAGDGVSGYWGRWTNSAKPWAGIQPQSQSVIAKETLVLSSTPANGFSGVSYQWRRNGVNVANGAGGASPGGGFVSGASGALASPTAGQAAVLTISGIKASDAGSFDVVFSNTCGSGMSDAAVVTVGSMCYPNCDGSVGSPILTANDFQCFLNRYASNDPYANCDGSTGTPLLTANDFQCFLNAYATGCR